jgi:diaminohydroxyphosphoribosylaminopyrimidine deaminase/5-amino-6-(5-phosphoribosylamino)uracil reductase
MYVNHSAMPSHTHVVLKLALSLDGRIATRTGASRWITGATARKQVHVLRAKYSAIGVGIGTVLADDPELTVRDAPGVNPIRVVFDSSLRMPATAKLVTTAGAVPTIAIAGEQASDQRAAALEAGGVKVVRVGLSTAGHLDLAAALAALADLSIPSILIEGGAGIAGALLAGRHVHELHAFIAPILLGPEGRPCAVGWSGPTQPASAPRIAEPIIETCGPDVYVHGPLESPASD